MPKMIRRYSSATTYRSSTPSSPELAKNFINYRFNHLNQRAVRPTKLGSADGWTTPNASGLATGADKTGQVLDEGYGFRSPVNDPGQVKV
jgi:hypothetical protein